MLGRMAILLLFISGCAVTEDSEDRASAAASSKKVCRPEWNPASEGLRHRDFCGGDGAALHLVEVDTQLWTLDAARVPPTTASAVAGATGAPFAINANFFDHDRKTLGAIVSGGQIVQRPHPVSWQSIFYVTDAGEPGIVLPEEWAPVQESAAMAVQAGPRIVVDGEMTDANPGTPYERSGVCLREGSAVLFFVTAPGQQYDVQEIAALAARNEMEGGLGCRDAMLFDGGPSTQIHLESSGISIEGELVPAFVLAHRRQD